MIIQIYLYCYPSIAQGQNKTEPPAVLLPSQKPRMAGGFVCEQKKKRKTEVLTTSVFFDKIDLRQPRRTMIVYTM